MESEKKTIEITSLVCIFLPVCNETKTDIFLKILKNVLARKAKKLDDHYIKVAFKSGMNAEEFSIDFGDMLGDWKDMNSMSQQICQAKLLGYWSINNFPSLGKKLFGENYRAPERKGVVIDGSKVVECDEIDAIIFSKMKIRIIQLDVGRTTLSKLKHFVKAPVGIGKSNEVQISPKMKSFDIDTDHLEECWKALKTGEFSINVIFKVSLL